MEPTSKQTVTISVREHPQKTSRLTLKLTREQNVYGLLADDIRGIWPNFGGKKRFLSIFQEEDRHQLIQSSDIYYFDENKKEVALTPLHQTKMDISSEPKHFRTIGTLQFLCLFLFPTRENLVLYTGQ